MSDFSIKENLSEIYSRISEAEKKSGRKPGSVRLLAVSKFHPQEAVLEAIEHGQLFFGENRVQEATQKFPKLLEAYPEVQLHIIGQLQTNKVRKAVQIAHTIQSVDSLNLICEIEKQAAKLADENSTEKNFKINILLELLTGEETKSGFTDIEGLREALKFMAEGNTPHVIPKGFMTMAPLTENTDEIRKSFRTLRETSEKLKKEFPQFDLDELSMGMSGDFEIAIEEGSTMVRIGTAIFGERQY